MKHVIRFFNILFQQLKYWLKKKIKTDKSVPFSLLYAKYQPYTMLNEQTFITNLKLCSKFSHLEGCIVECGTWKGGTLAAIAEYLNQKNRTYYAFDSFEGLPQAERIDGEKALAWQADIHSPTFYNNCSASYEDVKKLLKKVSIAEKNIIKGWFSETLPNFNEKIAILRLDADWYKATYECLYFLFHHVVDGGIIIIDDYYTWEGCTKATHEFLAQIQSNAVIKQMDNQVAYIQK